MLHAAKFVNGTVTDLGSLGGPAAISHATGINSWGTIVGFASTSSATTLPWDAFVMVNGTVTDLNTLSIPGLAVPLDKPVINDNGQIAATGSDGLAYLLTPVSGTATHLGVSTGNSAVAGAPQMVTVAALDTNNNPSVAYTGTIHLTSTDPAAVLPADHTLSRGLQSYAMTLNTLGAHTVTATDTVTGSLLGVSSTVAVAASLGASPTPTPTPTPTPAPGRIANLSARASVGTASNVLIAGLSSAARGQRPSFFGA